MLGLDRRAVRVPPDDGAGDAHPFTQPRAHAGRIGAGPRCPSAPSGYAATSGLPGTGTQTAIPPGTMTGRHRSGGSGATGHHFMEEVRPTPPGSRRTDLAVTRTRHDRRRAAPRASTRWSRPPSWWNGGARPVRRLHPLVGGMPIDEGWARASYAEDLRRPGDMRDQKGSETGGDPCRRQGGGQRPYLVTLACAVRDDSRLVGDERVSTKNVAKGLVTGAASDRHHPLHAGDGVLDDHRREDGRSRASGVHDRVRDHVRSLTTVVLNLRVLSG